MGSACRCTTFHSPSSGRKIIVVRRASGVMSSLEPTLASIRSIYIRKSRPTIRGGDAATLAGFRPVAPVCPPECPSYRGGASFGVSLNLYISFKYTYFE